MLDRVVFCGGPPATGGDGRPGNSGCRVIVIGVCVSRSLLSLVVGTVDSDVSGCSGT